MAPPTLLEQLDHGQADRVQLDLGPWVAAHPSCPTCLVMLASPGFLTSAITLFFFFFKEHNNTKTIIERLFSGPHATPEIYYPRENLDTGDCSYLLEGGRQTLTLET